MININTGTVVHTLIKTLLSGGLIPPAPGPGGCGGRHGGGGVGHVGWHGGQGGGGEDRGGIVGPGIVTATYLIELHDSIMGYSILYIAIHPPLRSTN